MFKIILIFILAVYFFFRVFGFVLRAVFGSPRPQPGGFQQQKHSRAREGDLFINNVPKTKTKRDRSEGFEGGDYVDFEEVK